MSPTVPPGVKLAPRSSSESTAPSEGQDTRARLLHAALLLFRQRGYHGVGISDILTLARAPKGSLYHHFPGGKDQMAVAVLELVTERLLEMLEAPASSTAELMRAVGQRLCKWMHQTSRDGNGNASACALIASFAAEGQTAVAVAAAARQAYERVAAVIVRRLEADGVASRAAARDTAYLVLSLLEGGGLVSQTLGEPRLFTSAIERAAALCEIEPSLRKAPS